MVETSTQSRTILIRADSGGRHGAGHVMRMIALGQAIQERGTRVALAHGECPPTLKARLDEEGIAAFTVGDGVSGSKEDVRQTVELARSLGCACVVLDGYLFGEDFQQALSDAGLKVLCVDDYGHCETWRAEFVLNQNLAAADEVERYRRTAKGAQVLLGPRYALLRREFRRCPSRGQAQSSCAWPGRILITFGGVDPDGATLRIIRALQIFTVTRLELVVLVGPANVQAEAVIAAAGDSPHRVEILRDVRDMPALYAAVDGVISAGGSSCYEWLYFGLSAWVTSIADNQDGIVTALHQRGLAQGVGKLFNTNDADLQASLRAWLTQAPSRPTALVDGLGANRVAAWLHDFPYFVRPVEIDRDARFLYDLANDPTVRAAGFHPNPITWDEHNRWLESQSSNPDARLFVIEAAEDGPVGQVRFHLRAPGTWEIGISLVANQRERGLSTGAVELGQRALRRMTPVTCWRARVRSENVRSARLFERLGFKKVEAAKEELCFECPVATD